MKVKSKRNIKGGKRSKMKRIQKKNILRSKRNKKSKILKTKYSLKGGKKTPQLKSVEEAPEEEEEDPLPPNPGTKKKKPSVLNKLGRLVPRWLKKKRKMHSWDG